MSELNLKQRAIISAFDLLTDDEKKDLMSYLTINAGIILIDTNNVLDKLDYDDKLKNLIIFMSKKWKSLTKIFVDRCLKRWDILKTSEAGAAITLCEEGDLYLQAKIWYNTYYRYEQFTFNENDKTILYCMLAHNANNNGIFFGKERDNFFNVIIPRECRWNEMFVVKLINKGTKDERTEMVKISDLMEMNDDRFKEIILDYGYSV